VLACFAFNRKARMKQNAASIRISVFFELNKKVTQEIKTRSQSKPKPIAKLAEFIS
jgi:hypothetical protein